MICFPNAKINVGLNIVEKRSDGFHNIESVFYPIGLCDVLEVGAGETGKCIFQSSGLSISGNTDSNLCVRAYNLLNRDFDLPSVQTHLHKIIPVGAGLGGGSSDGAFTIKLLNDLFDLKLSGDQMENYARKLGSDCAFFIKNQPVFAYERGDKFKLINIDLSGYYIVIVYPEIHINTSEAYLQVSCERKTPSIKELVKLPVSEWQGQLHNDFEDVIFPKHPEIKEIKEKLYSLGAEYASMSGSGSSVYGIFKEKVSLKAEFVEYFVWEEKLLRSNFQQINSEYSKEDIGYPHC